MMAFNILFTSAGRRVSLVREFKAALGELGLSGRTIAADLSGTAPAAHAADAHVRVPPVTSPEYVGAVEQLCKDHGIRLVVPLIDTELHLLAPHRERFAELGVELVVSSPDVTNLSLNKRNTHDFFVGAGVKTPRLLDVAAVLADPSVEYPLFLKPADGSCSIGARKLNNREELAFLAPRTPNALLQEFVRGDEYTMDALADFSGRTRCVVPRLRIETRAGEISKGITVKDPELIEACRNVVDRLPGARGCMTLQCFRTPGHPPVFIEINPRFGGGFPLSAAAGAAYPRWIIEWVLGRDPSISLDGWQDGLVMLRYDEAIFVRRGDIE